MYRVYSHMRSPNEIRKKNSQLNDGGKNTITAAAAAAALFLVFSSLIEPTTTQASLSFEDSSIAAERKKTISFNRFSQSDIRLNEFKPSKNVHIKYVYHTLVWCDEYVSAYHAACVYFGHTQTLK